MPVLDEPVNDVRGQHLPKQALLVFSHRLYLLLLPNLDADVLQIAVDHASAATRVPHLGGHEHEVDVILHLKLARPIAALPIPPFRTHVALSYSNVRLEHGSALHFLHHHLVLDGVSAEQAPQPIHGLAVLSHVLVGGAACGDHAKVSHGRRVLLEDHALHRKNHYNDLRVPKDRERHQHSVCDLSRVLERGVGLLHVSKMDFAVHLEQGRCDLHDEGLRGVPVVLVVDVAVAEEDLAERGGVSVLKDCLKDRLLRLTKKFCCGWLRPPFPLLVAFHRHPESRGRRPVHPRDLHVLHARTERVLVPPAPVPLFRAGLEVHNQRHLVLVKDGPQSLKLELGDGGTPEPPGKGSEHVVRPALAGVHGARLPGLVDGLRKGFVGLHQLLLFFSRPLRLLDARQHALAERGSGDDLPPVPAAGICGPCPARA